jgi:hypothetical protein
VTVLLMLLWLLAALLTLWSGFPAGPWAKGLMLLAAVYAVGLTVYAGRAR